MARIVITGDKAIDRKLRRLGAVEANKVVRKALRKQAKDKVKAAIERNAPVAETKSLKRSVIVRAGKRSRSRISIQVGYDVSKFKGEKFHPAFVEYGTSTQAPQGTMRQSFDQTKSPARDGALKEIRDGIERAAKG